MKPLKTSKRRKRTGWKAESEIWSKKNEVIPAIRHQCLFQTTLASWHHAPMTCWLRTCNGSRLSLAAVALRRSGCPWVQTQQIPGLRLVPGKHPVAISLKRRAERLWCYVWDQDWWQDAALVLDQKLYGHFCSYINNTFESFKWLLILKIDLHTEAAALNRKQPGEAEPLCSLSATLGHDSIFRTHRLIREI